MNEVYNRDDVQVFIDEEGPAVVIHNLGHHLIEFTLEEFLAISYEVINAVSE